MHKYWRRFTFAALIALLALTACTPKGTPQLDDELVAQAVATLSAKFTAEAQAQPADGDQPAESPQASDTAASPTSTFTPSPASLGGKVWSDLCSAAAGPPTPAGCVDTGGGVYAANGVLETGEPSFENVLVELGAGACPSSGLATTMTDSDGLYSFSGLTAGTYCVSIDPLDTNNESILIPGGWTYPDSSGATTVTVAAGEDRTDVNFGWDFQFD